MGSELGCCLTGTFPLEVTQGDDGVPFVFNLTYRSNCQGVPLNTASQITTNYLDNDGVTVLQHTLTAAQLVLINGGFTGSFQDTLSAAETAILNPGTGAIIVSYTIGGITKNLVLQGAIVVTVPPFPIA